MENSGIGTYIAYGFIIAFLAILALLTLRVMVLFSLLWIEPLRAVLRRVPLLRALVRSEPTVPRE
jgi:hypothetical protein